MGNHDEGHRWGSGAGGWESFSEQVAVDLGLAVDLDEPTNDLDLDGLRRLEEFVAGLRAVTVLVSHSGWRVVALGEVEGMPHPGHHTRFGVVLGFG